MDTMPPVENPAAEPSHHGLSQAANSVRKNCF